MHCCFPESDRGPTGSCVWGSDLVCLDGALRLENTEHVLQSVQSYLQIYLNTITYINIYKYIYILKWDFIYRCYGCFYLLQHDLFMWVYECVYVSAAQTIRLSLNEPSNDLWSLAFRQIHQETTTRSHAFNPDIVYLKTYYTVEAQRLKYKQVKHKIREN